MKILLTGGSGFIGKVFIEHASKGGHTIYSMGREWTDPNAFVLLPWKRIEAVVHLAAAGVKRGKRDWAECIEVNARATMGLLNAIELSPRRPFVIMARSLREFQMDHDKSLWSDPYVVSKRFGAELAMSWRRTYSGGFRFVNIGPCYEDGMVEVVAKRILAALP